MVSLDFLPSTVLTGGICVQAARQDSHADMDGGGGRNVRNVTQQHYHGKVTIFPGQTHANNHRKGGFFQTVIETLHSGNPNNCTVKGKPIKFTIDLVSFYIIYIHTYIPQKNEVISNSMIPAMRRFQHQHRMFRTISLAVQSTKHSVGWFYLDSSMVRKEFLILPCTNSFGRLGVLGNIYAKTILLVGWFNINMGLEILGGSSTSTLGWTY